jgi:hypothetical protein
MVRCRVLQLVVLHTSGSWGDPAPTHLILRPPWCEEELPDLSFRELDRTIGSVEAGMAY